MPQLCTGQLPSASSFTVQCNALNFTPSNCGSTSENSAVVTCKDTVVTCKDRADSSPSRDSESGESDGRPSTSSYMCILRNNPESFSVDTLRFI